MISILNAGWNLGKKIAFTGAAITSAPVILPPLMVVSALGFAFSVPFGLVFAGYVCNQKVMSYLLPSPYVPPEGFEMLHEDDIGEEAEGEEGLGKEPYPERPGGGSHLLDGEMVGAKRVKTLPEGSAEDMRRQSDAKNEKADREDESSGASPAAYYETKADDVDWEEETETREDEVDGNIVDEGGALPPENELQEAAVDEANVHVAAPPTSDTNVYDDTGRELGEIEPPRGTEKVEESGVLKTETNGNEIDERTILGDSPLAIDANKGDSTGRDQQSSVEETIDDDKKEKSLQGEERVLPAETGEEDKLYGASCGISGDDAGAQGPKLKNKETIYEKWDDNCGEDNGRLHVGIRKEEKEILLKENGEGIRADDKVGGFPSKIDHVGEAMKGFDEPKKREHKILEEDSLIEIEDGELCIIPPGGTCDIRCESVADDKVGSFSSKIDHVREDMESFDEPKKQEHMIVEEDSLIEIEDGEIGITPPGRTCVIRCESVAGDKVGGFPSKIDHVREDMEGFDEPKMQEHKIVEENSLIDIEDREIGKIPPGGTCDIRSESVSPVENNPVENKVQETEDKVEEEEDRDLAATKKTIVQDIPVKEVDESEESTVILGAEDRSHLPRSSEQDVVSTDGVVFVPNKASALKDQQMDEHTSVKDGHELNVSPSATEEHYVEKKDGESIKQPLSSASPTDVPRTGTATQAETKNTETMGHPLSNSRPSGVSSNVEASEASADQGLYPEEETWNEINALRTIVGYKADMQVSFMEELKALYVFAGVEPPASSDDSSNLAQTTVMLRFLKAVIGVR